MEQLGGGGMPGGGAVAVSSAADADLSDYALGRALGANAVGHPCTPTGAAAQSLASTDSGSGGSGSFASSNGDDSAPSTTGDGGAAKKYGGGEGGEVEGAGSSRIRATDSSAGGTGVSGGGASTTKDADGALSVDSASWWLGGR